MAARGGTILENADSLYRSAAECGRQHRRYARLMENGSTDAEQGLALEVVKMSDDGLSAAVVAYEKAANKSPGPGDAAWWHKANMLWHASREYIRHHAFCDGVARRKDMHGRDELGEMAVEFDLEASALLALRMAADSYGAVRPGVE
ncbi:MAG: hypothetical protein WKF55_16165 [Gemmatimonadaceae bacterium]